MLAIELTHHEMKERHLGFDEAKQFARRRIVMTNHTLLPAGNEIYSGDLVGMLLERYSEQLAVPVDKLVKLGLVQQSSEFSMSMLAFRMSGVINAVSRLHANKAKEIWGDHPMVAVTNGIHVPTWDCVGDAAGPGDFWKRHQENKSALLKIIKERSGRDWDVNALLIGWARRIVRYKRPTALFDDAARLAEVARRSERPIRFVFSGNHHPSDSDGAWLQSEIKRLADGDFKDIAVYLPNYDMGLAKSMTSGCDMWLNTPVVGFEACGTSGMKAALNGVLPLTTRDGWVDEVDLNGSGWIIHNDNVTHDLLDKLDKEIAPLYYTRDSGGRPEIWENHMRHSRSMILDRFTATRMLREYIEMMYL
jgi:starch phosphorylase